VGEPFLRDNLKAVEWGANNMSDEELQKTVDALNALEVELTSSPEKALAFLVKYGFLTPSGELTEPYKQGA
jgi:hypothetical protein